MANKKEKIALIKLWVENYRKKNSITPSDGPKFELSCTMEGEGHNLVMRQLVPTTFDKGSWISEIQNGDNEILDLALEYMKKCDSTLFKDAHVPQPSAS